MRFFVVLVVLARTLLFMDASVALVQTSAQAGVERALASRAAGSRMNMRLTSSTVNVAVNPAAMSVPLGSGFSVDIVVSAGTQSIDSVDAHFNFDPSCLQVTDITWVSTALMEMQKTWNNTAGTVDCAGLTFSFTSGNFTLCTVQFQAIATSAGTPLTFVFAPLNRKTQAQYLGVDYCAGNVTHGTVTIVGPTPTATRTTISTGAAVYLPCVFKALETHSVAPFSREVSAKFSASGLLAALNCGNAAPPRLTAVQGVFTEIDSMSGPVNIAVSPAALSVSSGSGFSVDVVVSAGTQSIDSVDAHLNFDPVHMQVTGITWVSTALMEMQKVWDNTAGTIDCAGLTFSFTSGTFTLCTVQFHAIGPSASTPLTFVFAPLNRKTQAQYLGVDYCAGNVTNGMITITGPTPTTTSTYGTVTNTPTKTPTHTPTSVSTNTPTSTPTNTTTNIPTGTATNTLTPTPTSTATNVPTCTATNTATHTPTGTPTYTPTSTATNTATLTPTNTPTPTPTSTATNTPTSTSTGTPINTSTSTPTYTPTTTLTSTPSETPTTPSTGTPDLSGVPAAITLQVEPSVIQGCGGTVIARAEVRDCYGYPVLDGTVISFAVTPTGGIEPIDGGRTTLSIATAIVFSTQTPGQGVVSAWWEPQRASVFDDFAVTFLPGPPYHLNLSTQPAGLIVGGNRAAIQLRVLDCGGYPVMDNTPVTFTLVSGEGSISPQLTVTTNGWAYSTLTSPDEAGSATIGASAGSCQTTTVVEYIADRPFAITLAAEPLFIPADGVSTSTIRAEIKDRYSNYVADATTVIFSTDLGSFESGASYVTYTLGGKAHAVLTAGTVLGRAHVTATSGGRRGETYVELTTVPTPTATPTSTPTSPFHGRSYDLYLPLISRVNSIYLSRKRILPGIYPNQRMFSSSFHLRTL